MTLIMRDSIDPFAIPLDNLAAVAGYGDGQWMWTRDGWARFPASVVALSIVTNPRNKGDILDVERGDAQPSDCPGWSDDFNRPWRRLPTIYCNRQTIDEVRMWMGSRPFDWFAATLDGTKDVPGAAVVQYAGENLTGGHYDESVILDPGWLGVGDMALTAQQDDNLSNVRTEVGTDPNTGKVVPGGVADLLISRGAAISAAQSALAARLDQLATQIAAQQLPPANLAPVIDALAKLQATLDRIEAGLKSA